MIFILIGIALCIVIYVLYVVKKNGVYVKIDDVHTKIYENQYQKKELITQEERYFYNLLKSFKNDYEVLPQVNLAAVIKKLNNQKYQTELYRNIDFGIFTKDYKELLLLIEINDQTHNTYKRKERDKKVKTICQIADIKLITFYTNYPNKPDYVVNRVKTELNNIQQSKINFEIKEQTSQQCGDTLSNITNSNNNGVDVHNEKTTDNNFKDSQNRL